MSVDIENKFEGNLKILLNKDKESTYLYMGGNNDDYVIGVMPIISTDENNFPISLTENSPFASIRGYFTAERDTSNGPYHNSKLKSNLDNNKLHNTIKVITNKVLSQNNWDINKDTKESILNLYKKSILFQSLQFALLNRYAIKDRFNKHIKRTAGVTLYEDMVKIKDNPNYGEDLREKINKLFITKGNSGIAITNGVMGRKAQTSTTSKEEIKLGNEKLSYMRFYLEPDKISADGKDIRLTINATLIYNENGKKRYKNLENISLMPCTIDDILNGNLSLNYDDPKLDRKNDFNKVDYVETVFKGYIENIKNLFDIRVKDVDFPMSKDEYISENNISEDNAMKEYGLYLSEALKETYLSIKENINITSQLQGPEMLFKYFEKNKGMSMSYSFLLKELLEKQGIGEEIKKIIYDVSSMIEPTKTIKKDNKKEQKEINREDPSI